MADFDDDDFDFGDGLEDIGKDRGVKRSYEESEDDEDELFSVKKPYVLPQSQEVIPEGGDDFATTTILKLRASLEAKEKVIQSLENELASTRAELTRWCDVFRGDFLTPGVAAGDQDPDPDVAMEAVMKVQASELRLREQLRAVKRKENAMLWKLSNKDQEILELKTMLHDAKEMTKPAALQARKLMLSPILHAEFVRLKSEVEASDKKVKEMQDDLAAVNFTPHSMTGKMLIAKCKALQDENEEYGRDEKEGKLHDLGNKLALQKQLNTELRRSHQELQDFVEDLNEEADKLQQTVFLLQQQLQMKDKELHDAKQARPMRHPPRMGRNDGRDKDGWDGPKGDMDIRDRRRPRDRDHRD